MKTYIFFLFLVLFSCGPDEPNNVDLQLQIQISDSIHRQSISLLEQKIMDGDRKRDSLETVVMHMKDKTAVLDSLVQRRAFKRDFWGKAGAFGKGLLGIPTFKQ